MAEPVSLMFTNLVFALINTNKWPFIICFIVDIFKTTTTADMLK